MPLRIDFLRVHGSSRVLFWLSLALAGIVHSPILGAAEPEEPSWEKHVRPLFKSKCFQCHGEGEIPKGGLDVRLARLVAKGGDSGPAVVPGKPDESVLFQRVRDGEMPPKDGKLTAAEIDVVRRWIAAGAKTLRPEPASPGDVVITEEERAFWSFQPVRRASVPAVKNAGSVQNEIDAFLLAALESRGLSFSPEADRPTLIRRLSFDVRGLPPSPEEVAAFVGDASPDAWERLVDRMLASPHYGERWARHWLDVAGYADSEGATDSDAVREEAWKYRDYVIRSLNEDKPYDRFVIEQLAGDELLTPPYKELSPQQIELLTATGFLRMAPDGTGSGAPEPVVARNQVVADTLQIVTSSLIGMTVACAQCHNHRYDPIPQTDYYRLRAVFEPAFDTASWRVPAARRVSLYTDADRQKSAEIEAEAKKILDEREKKQAEYIEQTFERELAKLPEAEREPTRVARNTPEKDRTPEQVQRLKEHPSVNVSAGSLYLYDHKAAAELKKMFEEAQKVRGTKPVEEFLRVLSEVPGRVPETKLFYRGDVQQPRETMSPGELTVLDVHAGAPLPAKDASIPTSGRRLAYARRLVDGTHPLTARVLVNRLWLHHFGRGLVASPSDFGALGEKPTHPELLDWLASELQGSGIGGQGSEKKENPAAATVGPVDGANSVAGAVSALSPDPRLLTFDPRSWSIKHLHRLMLTSSAYRQSSRRTAELDRVDPDNKLLGRMSVRRLEAEAVRDAVLAANGAMNVKFFGPPVPVMQDEVGQIVVGIENLNGENRPDKVIPLNGEEFRRSVYVQVRRSRPLGVLETFDSPAMTPNCESRTASTVATQSLMLMNSDFVRDEAERFAARVLREAGSELPAQASLAWRLAYGAEPSVQDLDEAASFLRTEAERLRARQTAEKPPEGKPAPTPPDPALRSLSILCQALLSSNRFLYVD